MTSFKTELSTGIVVNLAEKEPIHVLHVDDETKLLKVAKQCLEMEGPFQVDTALSVQEAMKKMEKKAYDVIISDYQMPGKDGLDFLKELRHAENNIPFIMFTGRGREEVVIKALNLGADQYINKVGGPEAVYGELAHSIRQAVKGKRAEERTRESEEKFRNIFESASDAMIYLDKTGRILGVNRKAETIFGGSKKELLGKHFAKVGILSPKDVPKFMKAFVNGLAGKHAVININIRNKRGQRMSLECQRSLMKTCDEITLLVTARDVTKRKQAEERLKKSEEKYKALLEETPIGICNLGIKGKIVYANKAFEQITGYSKDEILGKNALNLARQTLQLSDEKLKPITDRIKNRLTGIRESQPMTIQLTRKDGCLRWVEAESKLIKRLGMPVGLQAVIRDITERKQMEERLRESEERFRSIVENSHGGIGIVDDNFKIKYVNEQVTHILGYSKEEMVGQDFRKFLCGDTKPLIQDRYLRRQNGEKIPSQYEFEMIRKDGEKRTVEIKVALIKDGQSRMQTVAEVLDITDRKKAEQTILESRQRFIQLFMGNPEAAAYVDTDFRVLDVNPRFTQLFGFSLNEVKGKNLLDLIVPKERREEGMMLDEKAKKGHVYRDTVRKTKDGSSVPVAISAAPITVGDQLIGYVGLYKDISQLRSMEKAMKEMMVKLAAMNEKLRVVGRLARHDVRNKLSAVIGNVYLVKKKLTGYQETQEYLEDIESAVGQVGEIFDFAESYERLGLEESIYIDVKKSVGEAVSQFSELRNLKVVNDCRGLKVLADSLLKQLFYNLIDNSLKHGEKASQIRVFYEEIGKGQLKLIYEDDGAGIPQAEKKKIFKEGYGKGTGYGLYLIRRMCEVYGWTIEETGKPDQGAQFTITISKINERGRQNYRLS